MNSETNGRITFGTLLKVNTIVGLGAGLLLSPLRILDYAQKGDTLNASVAVLTAPVGGVIAALTLTFAGYPIYLFVANKRKGHTIKIQQYNNTNDL